MASTPPPPCHPEPAKDLYKTHPFRHSVGLSIHTRCFLTPFVRNEKRRQFSLVLLLLLLILLPGCGLLGKSGPEEVRLSVEVANGQEVRMITSTRFLTTRVQEIEDTGNIADSLAVLLLDADTSFITRSFDSLYDISFEQQFYVRLIRSSPQGDNLTTRVWVDDDLKFMSQPADPRDSLQFIYNFRGPIGQDNTDL